MSAIRTLINRAINAVPAPCPTNNNLIHLALSGGVDSSVAAFLLRERGYRVRPIFLRCWTSEDGTCVEHEYRAAQAATTFLQLPEPLEDWDFVREYWLNVFEPVLLQGLAAGLTPNPDIACNAFVKFGAFPQRLRETTGNNNVRFATGHYARLDAQNRLVRAIDVHKDQSYFMAHVRANELRGAIFPVGALLKSETRAIAQHIALPAAKARSSRGLCFVGARRLSQLLTNYIEDDKLSASPQFIDADTCDVVGQASDATWAYTVGQRARIGGVPTPYYVVSKSPQSTNIIVAKGADSPHLHTRTVRCERPHWIVNPPILDEPLFSKISSVAPLVRCTISAIDGEDGLTVQFELDIRRVGAGQVVAFYQNDLCLGGAVIARDPFPHVSPRIPQKTLRA